MTQIGFLERVTGAIQSAKREFLGLTLEDIPGRKPEEGLKVHSLYDFIAYVDTLSTIMPEMNSLLVENFEAVRDHFYPNMSLEEKEGHLSHFQVFLQSKQQE